MPDTTKSDQPHRIPRQPDSVRPYKPDPSALARLLDEWMQGDEAEQKATFDLLRRPLDEGRPKAYKLFA